MIALQEAMKLLAAINLQDHLVQLRQSTCILIVDVDITLARWLSLCLLDHANGDQFK